MEDRSKGLEIRGVLDLEHSATFATIGPVSQVYQGFKDYYSSKHEKRPKLIQGLDGVYFLKRLSEAI